LPFEIVGHAIVSADGMIATRDHQMPPQLRSDADWRRFQAELDQSRLVVLGRLGHEAHPNPGRLRLVATTRVARLDVDPADARAIFWNPGAVSPEAVLAELGITDGTVAVTGGTRVFDLFLPLFTTFELVRVAGVTLPDGLPCFSAGDPRQALTAEGLRAVQTIGLDGAATLTVWLR
jgi:dihydrofolate reductase